jgi:hypothetical protein
MLKLTDPLLTRAESKAISVFRLSRNAGSSEGVGRIIADYAGIFEPAFQEIGSINSRHSASSQVSIGVKS